MLPGDWLVPLEKLNQEPVDRAPARWLHGAGNLTTEGRSRSSLVSVLEMVARVRVHAGESSPAQPGQLLLSRDWTDPPE